MRNKKFWVNLLLILCCLSGCAAPAKTPTVGITLTDDLGRQVTLAEPPERVAALIGSFADVWTLAGGTLCAAAEDAWSEFGLNLPDAANLGGAHSPNTETLLAAEPDLVLASASTASNVEMMELLEQAGIPVAYFDVDCFEEYLSMLKRCTDLTGRADLYEQNGLRLQTRIEQIRAQTASAALSDADRTVLLLRASSGSVKAKGSEGTILGEMLRDLGCTNVADRDGTLLETLSAEAVIRQNPRHVFVVTMGDDTEKATENFSRLLRENPAWSTLDAVQNGRLHIMNRKLFNLKPNAKWADSYEKLAEILLAN